jgi:hypothetical protein
VHSLSKVQSTDENIKSTHKKCESEKRISNTVQLIRVSRFKNEKKTICFSIVPLMMCCFFIPKQFSGPIHIQNRGTNSRHKTKQNKKLPPTSPLPITSANLN